MRALTQHREKIIVAIISAGFLILALYNLGSRDVPVTTYTTSGEEAFIVDLGVATYVNDVLVLIKNGETTLSVQPGSPGSWDAAVSGKVQGYYSWVTLPLGMDTTYLRFTFASPKAEIAELALVSDSGQKIPIRSIRSEGSPHAGLEKLVDEQAKVDLPVTAASETVFDEVYFVRAAEDYLNGRPPSEVTHPPLGKEMIALGIAFQGYSPFGWRILEAVFATLMIPVLYVLGEELSGSKAVGVTAAILLSLDFMHFTYARIATVDTFTVFFTMVSWFFFIRYLKTRRLKPTKNSDLMLWAVSSGLAFSTKWYALFGLIGQVLILFAFGGRLLPETGPAGAEKQWGGKLSALAIVAAVSGAVYLCTYLPQVPQGLTIQGLVAEQFQMLGFHTGLTATHPYSSPWYSWPLILRPLWMYVSDLPGNAVSTIVAMGNPAIWWMGFAAVLFCTDRYQRRRDLTSLFIVAIFFTQWLVFALITRPLFIYHYYINVPVICLASAILLREAWNTSEWRPIVVTYVVAAAFLLFLFYPVISGGPVSRDLVNSLRWFSSWVF